MSSERLRTLSWILLEQRPEQALIAQLLQPPAKQAQSRGEQPEADPWPTQEVRGFRGKNQLFP